ncbi:LacI family DNA-binding transcriptional regulator [Ligilactobacillus equi]|uniref:LacI family DNA-binding transcriptional regulator n=1 Tax=Ligilactobacillus equi TaxID=137357 RepID=UPI002ED38E23
MTTMKDVARRAGVSVGTVSRYINQAPGLKEKTISAVKQAIADLNYIPDEYAKGLKTNNTQTVVLLVPTVWHPFFSEFAYYVEQYLSAKNYKMILCNSDHDPQKEQLYVQMVIQNKIDGIIGITYNDLGKYTTGDIPFVSIDRYFDEDTSYISSDNYDGGRQAAQAMIAKGSKYLMYFGDKSIFANDTMRRRDGFRAEITHQKLPYDEIYDENPLLNLDERLHQKLVANPQIDGIFCVTDAMARKVITALKKQGIEVPAQIQVVGYDGSKAYREDPQAMLSTIVQPVAEMAEAAVKVILDKIENKNDKKIAIHLPVKFHPGTTTR